MPLRPTGSCRALQRRSNAPLDSVWISDDGLQDAFQNFYNVSRTAKRYGSCVPGPMEFRRRMDRRRMTHLSQYAYNPPPMPGYMLFRDVDRTNWTWQPPATLQERAAKPKLNPIAELFLNLQVTKEEDVKVENLSPKHEPSSLVLELRKFPAVFRKYQPLMDVHGREANSTRTLRQRYRKLLSELEQGLLLGQVPRKEISAMLYRFTTELRRDDKITWSKLKMASDQSCLMLYTTIVKGMTESKVFTLADMPSSFINALVMHISCLHLKSDVRQLARLVLRSATATQLQEMEPGIKLLLQKWMRACVKHWPSHSKERHHSWQQLQLCLEESEQKLNILESLMVTKMDPEERRSSEDKVSYFRIALAEAQTAVSAAGSALTKCEIVYSPKKNIARELAETLQVIPQDQLLPLISNCLNQLDPTDSLIVQHLERQPKATNSGKQEQFNLLASSWLSVLAHMTSVDTDIFMQNMRASERRQGHHFTFHEYQKVDLFLSHWVSQGLVGKADALKARISFETRLQFPEKDKFVYLILSLHKYTSQSEACLDSLLQMLIYLGQYRSAYHIIERLKQLGYKVQASLLRDLVTSMTPHNLTWAYRIFALSRKMILPDASGNPCFLDARQLETFVVALIDSKIIGTLRIWNDVLRVPWYNINTRPEDNFIRRRWKKVTMVRRIMGRPETEFWERIALAFAHAECREPRVAFANVHQVYRHLAFRRSPIRPAISRAMVHAVIARDINNPAKPTNMKAKLKQQRLAWLIKFVRRAEGPKIAEEVWNVTVAWRTQQDELERQERENELYRTRWLRGGPID